MNSLYSKYILEREGKEIIETDYGFITYIIKNIECYIVDIYIKPELRRQNKATELANMVTEIAKDRNCAYLIGTVSPKANGSTESLKTLLSYGFELFSSSNDIIVFKKKIHYEYED